MTLDRRTVVLAAASLPFATRSIAAAGDPFVALEQSIGGRLGVAALDTGTGKRLAHHADERFPMCSTFKLLAAADVLSRVDRGNEKLDRWIAYTKADLLDVSPITSANVGKGGMTLGALCAAAVEYSDNTAADLMLATLGGPAGVTRYVRSVGDHVTRLDRIEPYANAAIAGDPRDTTAPGAMLADLQAFTLGNALSKESRGRLTTWLVNCRTLFPRIPAGLPAGWKSGNKMGTGANGSTNNVTIIWPPGRSPILIAAYCTGSAAPRKKIESGLAEVGRIVAVAFV
jgi:beta-lactamase class A